MLSKYVVCIYVVFSFVVLLPSCMPLSSKKRVYIKCSLVVGFSIRITLFCLPCCLTDKSIVSNSARLLVPQPHLLPKL